MITLSRCRTGFSVLLQGTPGIQGAAEELMLDTGILTKDLGTILVGEDAVREGLINEVGGISDALRRLYTMISRAESRIKRLWKEQLFGIMKQYA